MKPCVITIQPFDKEQQMDIKTGDVSYYEIVNFLSIAQKHFAREICKAAEKSVGPDPKKQEEWMEMMIQKHKNNEF